MNMDSYGILDGINEVIVTTRSGDGRPNAAPIGVIRRGAVLKVHVYNGSHTCDNIRETGLLAANVVHDPVAFVRSALGEVVEEMFQVIPLPAGKECPVMKQSDAWVVFEAEHTLHKNGITAQLYPIKGAVNSTAVRSINRGSNAVIEVVVLATRYRVFNDDAYLTKIRSYFPIINKCGGERDREAYELVVELLS